MTATRTQRRTPIGPGFWLPSLFLASVLLAGILAPAIAPHDPLVGRLPNRLLPPAWMEGSDPAFPLGTDNLGRDILSRLLHGARISMTVSIVAVVVAGTFGTVVGLVAGYFRGRIDRVLMAITDIAFSLPLILMAIVLVAVLGQSLLNVIIVIVFLLWPYYARQVRGEALAIREQDFVLLARIAGVGDARIMIRHILPNILPSLFVLVTTQVAAVILLEASLSYLGVGIPAPTPAWGLMVADGQSTLAVSWWPSLFPGLAIALTVFSFTILGDWLRDRLDPTIRGMR